MKRVALPVLAVVGMALVLTGCLQGEKQPVPTKMDSLGWWPTKAVPQPKADPRPGMDGEWWWATERGEEQDPLWGNRGFVYVLRRTGKEEPGDGVVELPRGLKPVEALVFEDVNFEFDKSEILPAGQKILDEVVTVLTEYPEAIVTLEGHACSIGSEEHNMALGKRRATAVYNYLVEHGIAAERLTVVSYGKTRLKYYSRATGRERRRRDFEGNRRVEFKVTVPEEVE